MRVAGSLGGMVTLGRPGGLRALGAGMVVQGAAMKRLNDEGFPRLHGTWAAQWSCMRWGTTFKPRRSGVAPAAPPPGLLVGARHRNRRSRPRRYSPVTPLAQLE